LFATQPEPSSASSMSASGPQPNASNVSSFDDSVRAPPGSEIQLRSSGTSLVVVSPPRTTTLVTSTGS
jgi:hypothetical protein